MSVIDRLRGAWNYFLTGGNYSFITVIDSNGNVKDFELDNYLEAYYSNAFRACLLAKARPLSSLPVRVYERKEGVRVDAEGTFAEAYSLLLRHKWNPFMTAAEGTRWLEMTKDTLGEAFARVEFNMGIPVAIWPLSRKPTIEIMHGHPVFNYGGDKFTPAGRYLENEIIWVKSPILDSDGLHGVSLAMLAAQEVNLSINLSDFYGNIINGEAPTSGWIETDQPLDQQSYEMLSTRLSANGGIENAGHIKVLDRGLHYKRNTTSPVDMNLVEQEKWILQETCRTLSVPPQEVFELSNATYSNIEQGAINFANKTLVPECVALETAFSSILWGAGYTNLNVQLDMNGLMRGSYKERMEGYRIAVLGGAWLTRAEVRTKEDMPPIKGMEMPFVPTAYNLLDPNTGEIVPVAGTKNNANPQPGGNGDSERDNGREPVESNFNPHAMGTALAVVHHDAQERVKDRYLSTGDTPKFRAFAKKVLSPFAKATELEGIEYTIDDDIEEIINSIPARNVVVKD